MWQRTFKKITHFEKKNPSALNSGPNQRTLSFFQCAPISTISTHLKKNFVSKCVDLVPKPTHFELFSKCVIFQNSRLVGRGRFWTVSIKSIALYKNIGKYSDLKAKLSGFFFTY